ncbi:peptidylprolyl isomerase [Sandaracinobacteroides saxicola]|uniref:Parvulin-like PPIase n=1 Tax=Sandaracinobacteroides saxicola TaxID=2759707 RepID=A0A7G5IJW4_9SPHN|nr:peptidylprolyl isomerase [Sandaracinobacteroides saxicola]QMW23656.1 peptidyl-prolyl cis-trans isomerase [Sandaracinobacteroides saxicola]
MLSSLRKSATSWVGVIILGVVIIAFVVTLFHDPMGGGGRGASGATLATVGKAPVTEADYMRMFDRAIRQQRETSKGMTNAQFVTLGGADAVFEQMVEMKALDAFAARAGLDVSKKVLDGEIASIPAAQLNGKFDEASFRRLLQDQRLSEAQLRELLSADIRRRQLLTPVSLGTSVPAGIAKPYADLLLEARRGAILVVPAALMRDVPAPTEAQVAAFYAANKAAYTVPERRAFRWAMLDAAAFAAQAAPTEAQVAAYFKENAAEFGGVETRTLNQVVLQDRAAAERLVAAARGGQGFAAAAAAAGFTPADTALGSQTQAAFAGASSAAVAAAAFRTPVGGVSDAVQSPLGWHVVQVAAVTAAKPQGMAAARATIVARLTEEKEQDLLADAVAKAEDRFTGGESFADVARDLKLIVNSAPPLTADGRVLKSDYRLPADAAPILSKLFDMEPNEPAQVVEVTKGRFALVELGDVTPPTAVPLAEIRPAVVAAWTQTEAAKRAEALAKRLAGEAGKGASLASLAAANGLPAPQTVTVRRLELSQMAQQGQAVPPPVVMLLNTPAGRANVAPAPGGQGWFVVKTDAVTPGNAAALPQLVAAVRSSFGRDSADEMAAAFGRAVQRDVGVVRGAAALAGLKRKLAGEGAAAQ